MLIDQRRRKIVDILNLELSISAKELSQRFNVSEMTIWRDLKQLEKDGLIRRVRGGIFKEETPLLREPEFDAKQQVHSQEKEAIARYAATHLVAPGEIILLEGGTTVASMVPFLKHQRLTILTNGFKTLVPALPYLSDMTVMICGGILRDTSHTLVGPQAESFFAQFRAHKLFISGTALNLENGLTDPNLLEIQVKQAMARSADKIILLLDSSKLGQSSLAAVVPLEAIAILVTDQQAPQQILSQLNQIGMEIHIVNSGSAGEYRVIPSPQRA